MSEQLRPVRLVSADLASAHNLYDNLAPVLSDRIHGQLVASTIERVGPFDRVIANLTGSDESFAEDVLNTYAVFAQPMLLIMQRGARRPLTDGLVGISEINPNGIRYTSLAVSAGSAIRIFVNLYCERPQRTVTSRAIQREIAHPPHDPWLL